MPHDPAHMTSLFENATEGIILTDNKGKIELVNPAAETMFKYKANELIGSQIEILIPNRSKPNHENLRKGFYKHPQNRVMGHGRDLYARKKDGEEFPVEVSLSHYEREGELFVIAFIIDITFRKKIEQNMIEQQKELEKMTNDMRRLNAELEAKVEGRTIILKEALLKLEQSQAELNEALQKERELNDIKSRFVSMASHEFRTPLSTVLSSASLLSKYTAEEEQDKRDKHINKIKTSVKNLNDILEDFLSLGKLDEGKIIAAKAEMDLRDLINDTVEEVKGFLKKGQRFTCEHFGQSTIFSDKKLLKNILINLLTNAIKFSAEDDPIAITSLIENDKAKISITDKGIGISEEDLEHLFSSFFRAKNAVNIQGTGLGLHIVKRYIDLLGGNIDIKSKINEGTTISFSIPIQ